MAEQTFLKEHALDAVSAVGQCWHADFDSTTAATIVPLPLQGKATSVEDSTLLRVSTKVKDAEPKQEPLPVETPRVGSVATVESKPALPVKVSSLLERVRQRNTHLAAHKRQVEAAKNQQTRKAQLSRCLEICDIIKEYLITTLFGSSHWLIVLQIIQWPEEIEHAIYRSGRQGCTEFGCASVSW